VISRRAILSSLAALVAAGPGAQAHWLSHRHSMLDTAGGRGPWYLGSMRDSPFNVPIVNLRRIDPIYHRQFVAYGGPEEPGTIVVDTARRFLFLVEEDGVALRYGIGVGRQGFAWSGTAEIQRKARWPGWTPPAEMRRRQPELPEYMEGGLDNPLGARALYLYQDGRDTLYRLHGTNEPWSIGRAVSSGCIRLLNQDIIDLYDRVLVGALVIVKPPAGPWRPELMSKDGPDPSSSI
jgi:lipoprotein-anchoring transpeptidase ErfK/SrfK